jgi:hypothetical protein
MPACTLEILIKNVQKTSLKKYALSTVSFSIATSSSNLPLITIETKTLKFPGGMGSSSILIKPMLKKLSKA